MVRVFYWNKGNEETRRWNTQQCYHFPDCYVKQGMDYLARNPYAPRVRVRKVVLSPEDARKRFLLVRKFNELVQRRGKLVDGYPESLLSEANLTRKMVEVMLEVATLGGVPKSWSQKLI